jgi:NitT/TauT family transport system permease protein/sulfonate transport system permease protein
VSTLEADSNLDQRSARRGMLRRLLPFVGLVGVISLWGLLSAVHIVNPLILPSPLAVFNASLDQAANGVLVPNMLISLQRVLIGYALAVVVGVSLGLVVGWNELLYTIFNPVIEALRPIPPIAWIPLAILWFGLTNTAA